MCIRTFFTTYTKNDFGLLPEKWAAINGEHSAYLQKYLYAHERVDTITRPYEGLMVNYRVVENLDGTLMGINDEYLEFIPLTHEEVVKQRVDWQKVVADLMQNMGMRGKPERMQYEDCFKLGVLDLGDGSESQVYALFNESRNQQLHALMHILFSVGSGSAVVLLPTAKSVRQHDSGLLLQKGVALKNMGEVVHIDQQDRLCIAGGAQSLLGDLRIERGIQANNEHAYAMYKDGNNYRIQFRDESQTFTASKGLAYIHTLLQSPDTPIHVNELKAAVDKVDVHLLANESQDMFDKQALSAIDQRIAELYDDMEMAQETQNEMQLATLHKQLDQLIQEKEKATGLGGRSRKNTKGDGVRISVGRAIKRALESIASAMPKCSEHLQVSIIGHSGFNPHYEAQESISWQIE